MKKLSVLLGILLPACFAMANQPLQAKQMTSAFKEPIVSFLFLPDKSEIAIFTTKQIFLSDMSGSNMRAITTLDEDCNYEDRVNTTPGNRLVFFFYICKTDSDSWEESGYVDLNDNQIYLQEELYFIDQLFFTSPLVAFNAETSGNYLERFDFLPYKYQQTTNTRVLSNAANDNGEIYVVIDNSSEPRSPLSEDSKTLAALHPDTGTIRKIADFIGQPNMAKRQFYPIAPNVLYALYQHCSADTRTYFTVNLLTGVSTPVAETSDPYCAQTTDVHYTANALYFNIKKQTIRVPFATGAAESSAVFLDRRGTKLLFDNQVLTYQNGCSLGSKYLCSFKIRDLSNGDPVWSYDLENSQYPFITDIYFSKKTKRIFVTSVKDYTQKGMLVEIGLNGNSIQPLSQLPILGIKNHCRLTPTEDRMICSSFVPHALFEVSL